MSTQANGNGGALTVSTAKKVGDLLKANKGPIVAAMPKHINPDRLMRVAVQAISTTPLLAECTATSLVLAIIKGAMLGLEPNGPLGEAYLVPFRNRSGQYEAQFMPGYRGLINCARRSGEVREVYAHIVHQADVFEMELGLHPKLRHVPGQGERGPMLGVYAVYHTANGSHDFEYMTKAEVDGIRGRSRSANNGPWVTDYNEMAKKTAIRRLAKRMPMSVELADLVAIDEKVAGGEKTVDTDVIDIVGLNLPEDVDVTAKGAADHTAAAEAKLA